MKLKKVLAILMASAMIMGMSMTTFAAPVEDIQPTTITITNPDTDIPEDAGLGYEYVQIVQRDATKSYGWKFTDNEFLAAFEKAFDTEGEEATINALFNIAEKDIDGNKDVNANAEAGKIHASYDLGEALTALKTKVTTPVENNIITASTAGLYLIVGHAEGYTWNPMLAYVDETEQGTLVAASVQAKASKDQVGKEIVIEGEDTGKTVMKGDTIPYKITAEYPYYPADSTDNVFTIVDTVSNATIEQESVVIDGFIEGEDEDYTILFSDNEVAHTSTMTITFNYDHAKAGTSVVVNYNAIVGDISKGEQVINDATSTTNTGYTVAEVITDSAEFTVTKVEKDTNEPLDGAEFTVYVKDANGNKEIEYNGETIKVNVVDVLTTGMDGKATIKGLDVEKDYYIVETNAPAGYSRNEIVNKLEPNVEEGDEPIWEVPHEPVKDTDENETEFTKITTEYQVADYKGITVEDTKLSSLPSTGGIGTTIFTIGGCVIMISAAGLYFASRRKQENK